MNNQEAADSRSTVQLLQGKLTSGIQWLAQPAKPLSEPEYRRAHLLSWLLLFLVFLSLTALLLVLLVDPPDSSHRNTYVGLILGLTILVTVAYRLNRAGYYSIAARLTIACALLGPWGSVILDPSILQGDFVPLTYVALTILLSSMLLPPLVTVALAALQLGGLALVSIISPASALINWPSLLAMIFFTSVLSIVANLIQQRDINLIESQARHLVHSNRLIYALTQITTSIEKPLNRDEIIQTLGEELDKFDLTCTIALYEKEQQLFTIKYASMDAYVLQQMERRLGYPLIGSTFSLKKLHSILRSEDTLSPIVVTNPENEIQILFMERREKGVSEFLQGIGIGSEAELLRLPLVFEEELLGILWLWGKGIKQTDLPMLTIFAKQIGTSLERSRLFQEVQSLALTDHLTGLRNRRSLFELGTIEFSRSLRMQRDFCCMMLDLDHFKQINDTYGHPVGDQVIQEFAKRCQCAVRDVDLIGRYGGEEILIFLPETDRQTAMQVADRLRASVAEQPVNVSGQKVNITVSIGVSGQDENTLELDTLIARADQAMYMAKHKGRNRVAIST
jgi:diguanylate cyclase (GGDEF)-like protein